MQEAGVLLYGIVKDIMNGDAEICFIKIRELQAVLERNGCYAIYADDARVADSENLRVDFREDYATATELPGLYTIDRAGNYCRVGILGGTVRRE